MSLEAPKVSIIVATYSPGDALSRVIDSLDAQTMPQAQFETIFVDDGSPDDTHARLQQLATTRPNMQVHRIENSGWPSRPRNVGIEAAKGEYLVFMDHDDSLYPDALRSAYEFAKANHSDVVSPKESKTDDSWWQMEFAVAQNLPDVTHDRGVRNLTPLVPHKMYSRKLFIDNHIRFPEGSRVLWEDVFINVDAYAHAEVVSVMAETPFYLWHVHGSNSSYTFDPARADFYDRLDDMMDHIRTALGDERHADARSYLLAHQVGNRVINRTLALYRKGDSPVARRAVLRARELAGKYMSDEVNRQLSLRHRVMARALLAGRPDLMSQIHDTDLRLSSSVSAAHASWAEGALRLDVNARFSSADGVEPALRMVNGRVMFAVSEGVRDVVGDGVLDFTDGLEAYSTTVLIRSRADYLSWYVPLELLHAGFEASSDGRVALTWRGTGQLDLGDGAAGHPVPAHVYDFRTRHAFAGLVRKGGLGAPAVVLPALVNSRPAVAYRSAKNELALDLTQSKRTLAIDSWPRRGSSGVAADFELPLENIAVFGDGSAPANLSAIPEKPSGDIDSEVAALAAKGQGLSAEVVSQGGEARLRGRANLTAGIYRLCAERDHERFRTGRSIVVDETGGFTLL